MAHVKGGNVARKRRRKVLKLAKGYYGSKRTLYKTAHEQVMKSLTYAYRDRKQRKRNFRKLWIQRINAAARINGMSYSRFMNGLKKSGVDVNRKMLAEIAVHDMDTFANLIKISKDGLASTATAAKVEPKVEKVVKKAEPKVEKVVKKAEPKVEKVVKKAEPKVEKVVKKAEPKVEKVVDEVKETKSSNFESMTVAELKAIAKEKGITGYSKLKKSELLEILK